MKPGRWKYWLIHTAICAAVTIPFALVGYGEQAATAMALFYTGREIYQGYTIAEGFTWPQIGDAGGPVLFAVLMWVVR